MRNNYTKLYAKALSEILSEELEPKKEKEVIENFINLLKSKGYQKKAKEIMELAENILLKKQGKRKITLLTARKITPEHKKMLQNIMHKGDIVREEINPELIAGLKVIVDEAKQFDFSLKNKLDKLFL